MKTKIGKLLIIMLASVLMLALASCSKEHKKSTEGMQSAMNQPVEIGRMEAAAITEVATVQSIDSASRTVTLQGSDGTIGTYKLGEEVRNFDQIQVGDQVKATVVESMAVFVGPSDVKPNVGAIQTVALAPKGAKPGAVVTNTAEAVVRVDAVDAAKRTVTFTGFADVPRTLTVGPSVNLANVKVGDKVVMRYTQAMAIAVEKP
jgi:hypothetical protein